MKTKICTKCKTPLYTSDFHKDRNQKYGLFSWCKICNRERVDVYRRKYPWKITLNKIKQRCNNKNNNRYKYYGGRGIKCLITSEELEKLWFRDKAYLMVQPTIDKSENNNDYTYNNCKYIENIENSVKDKRKTVYQYTIDGVFMREWNSVNDVDKALNIHHSNISNVCLNKRNHAGGYIWKYKN